jgi:hypothetical protein
MLRIYVHEWQHKGRRYKESLLDAGCILDDVNPDVVLFDHDLGLDGKHAYRPELLAFAELGARVFIYPHAGPPTLLWDGAYLPYPGIRAVFVPAPGHAIIMSTYGYPHPIIVAGWSLCELKPLVPRQAVNKVLFAPIHPSTHGYLSLEDRAINADAMTKLMRLGVDITVRYIGELGAFGLRRLPGVHYVQGALDGSTREIDEADLVVAANTFLYLAVARGVPALSIRENAWPCYDRNGRKRPKNWHEYQSFMRYPYDVSDYEDLGPIAVHVSALGFVSGWRKMFIGEAFDAERVLASLRENQ